MLIGYARVSADQNPDDQIAALRGAGVVAENIHVDQAGWAKASRPQLDRVLQELREATSWWSPGWSGSGGRCCTWSRSVRTSASVGSD